MPDLVFGRHSCIGAINREDNKRALAYFQRAIELDPKFALAWAQAASCYWQRVSWRWVEDAAVEAREAERLSRQALALDANDPRVLTHAGMTLCLACNLLEEGLLLLEKATELDSNLFLAWLQRGIAAQALGQASAPFLERALRLSPRDFRAPAAQSRLAMAYSFAGDHAKAVEYAEAALRNVPKKLPPIMLAAIVAYAQAGRVDRAKVIAAEFLRLNPNAKIAELLTTSPHAAKNQKILAEACRLAGLPE